MGYIMDNKPLSLKTLEEYLGVSRRTLFRWIKDGHLPAIKMGGRWVVREHDLELFLKRRLFFFAGQHHKYVLFPA